MQFSFTPEVPFCARVSARVSEPPGEVDNSRIAVTKGGVTVIKLSSDYGQLSEQMWRFLIDIYGGGPELILKQSPPPPAAPVAPPVASAPTLAQQAQQGSASTGHPAPRSETKESENVKD